MHKILFENSKRLKYDKRETGEIYDMCILIKRTGILDIDLYKAIYFIYYGFI